jgi:membrane protease YdiL (CAAX protease family)
MFGVIHVTSYPLVTLPGKTFFGVVACVLYECTGSVLPGIFLHSVIDAGAFEMAYTGGDILVLIIAVVVAVSVMLISVAGAIRRFRKQRSGVGVEPKMPWVWSRSDVI